MADQSTARIRNALHSPVSPARVAAIVVIGAVAIGAALRAYPSLRHTQLVRELQRADEHEAPRVREQLAKLHGPRAFQVFSSFLASPTSNLRLQGLEGLRENGGDTALIGCLPLMDDWDARIRVRIAEMATMSSVPPSADVLLACVEDEDDWVREIAVKALGGWLPEAGRSRPRFLSVLAGAVDAPEPAVVGHIMSVMRREAGVDFGYRNDSPLTERRAALARWRAWWAHAAPPAGPPPSAYRITHSVPAPPFAVTDTAGSSWSLRSVRGRTLLLHFFGTWCGPCEREMTELEALHRRHPEVAVVALGIAEKGAEDLIAYARRKGITYPLALCPDSVSEAYGDIHKVPVTFLVDGEGRIRRRYDGSRDPSTYERALEALRIR